MTSVDLDAFADWDMFVVTIALMFTFAIIMAVAVPELLRRSSPVERLARRRHFGV